MSLPPPRPAPSVDALAAFAQLNADQQAWARRAAEAQSKAAQAYARLIDHATRSDTGQARRIAQFIAATYNGHAYAFDLFDLRALDVDISDDMLVCMDALRWGKLDLHNLVPNGDAKVRSIIKDWAPRKISAEA